MKLRTRLTIAFFVIIFVPVCLASLAFIGFGNYQIKSMEESYGIEDLTYESFSNSVQMISQSTQKLFEKMQKQARENPGVFLDTAYLEGLNDELR